MIKLKTKNLNLINNTSQLKLFWLQLEVKFIVKEKER